MDLSSDIRGQLRCEVLTAFSDVALIAAEWDELLERSRCNRAYSCTRAFLDIEGVFPGLEPLVLIARRDGALAGVMALVVDPAAREARFPDNWTDYHDIVAADDDVDAMTTLLELAVSGLNRYDRVLLNYVRPDSNCLRATGLLNGGGAFEWSPLPGISGVYSYIDLRQGYDEYLKSKGAHFRKHLKWRLRKAQSGGVIFRELKREEYEPKHVLEQFLTLHVARFGSRSVITASSVYEAYHNRLFLHLFASGKMRAFALFRGESIVGIDVALVGRNSLLSACGGFHADVASCSPGHISLHGMIQQVCEDRMDELDLGQGVQEYKASWISGFREVGTLQFAAAPSMLATRASGGGQGCVERT